MKQGLRDIDWDYAGAALARADDNEQAVFFKAFIKECNSWGTNHQVQMQLAFINAKLTKDERETLGMLGYEKEGTR